MLETFNWTSPSTVRYVRTYEYTWYVLLVYTVLIKWKGYVHQTPGEIKISKGQRSTF